MKREQQVFMDKDSINVLSQKVSELSATKVFLVRGKKSYETCGAKAIIDSLATQLNIQVFDFFDFSENPKIEDLQKGLSLFLEIKADIIIGMGGGSVIDMAKLIRFFYAYTETSDSVYVKQRNMTPMIAIPTTSGTGSETTHFAVLYKDKTKYSIAHSDIVPDVAIIHSPFTYNVPAYLAACTGFDALAQAIEAYWNVNATKESDTFAAKALELLWNSLPVAINKQINEARDKIAEGAYWAGKAINITQTTAPHAMSYAFTSYYGIPHGHAVALTFPYFVSYNTQTPCEEYCGKESYESFQKRINSLYNLLSLKKSDDIFVFFKEYIKSIGLSFVLSSDFNKEVISNNVNIQRAQNNPRVVTNTVISMAIDSIN